MRKNPWLTIVVVVVGALAGVTLSVKSVAAVPECEKNVCILGTGNCDVSVHAFNCKETTGGYGCSMSYC